MGYCENSREVRLYGAAEEGQPGVVVNDRRFPKNVGLTSESIMTKPKFNNYD